MINQLLVIELTIVYFIALFAIAYLVEKKISQGKKWLDNPLVYALALAVYCTAWTYYGNVGLAASSGLLFVAVYIGPSLFFIFWWSLLRKLVRIRNEYNITSIADFISARYGKSTTVAAIAAAIAFIGIVPYLSLQLKAIFNSFAFITSGYYANSSAAGQMDLIILIAIILFAIVFGFRSLDQTERHPGLVMVVAIQSVVKLIAFLAAGIFVVYFLNDGFADIFTQVANNPLLLANQRAANPSYSLFMAYLILSMSAIIFLPRQFHMAVVENTNEKHIRPALWLLSLYFILITLFVVPIALVGLLEGHGAQMGDIFILLLPLKHGAIWLSFLVFLGGLAAGTSMIMISGMTITTMVSNHLILPLLDKVRVLNFLRKHLLFLRWALITLILFIAYAFEVKIGTSYMLIKIGMISFAAVLQFAPAIIGALYWPRGNKTGAILGLASGFAVWSYTSLFPAFIKSGWLDNSILTDGPLGIRFLRPEHLFGVANLDPLAGVVLFTMLFNIGFYVVGSLLSGQSEEEKRIAYNFCNILKKVKFVAKSSTGETKLIDAVKKKKIINVIFSKYFNVADAERLTNDCLVKAGMAGKDKITIHELIELQNRAEKTLASSIGAAAAMEAFIKDSLFEKAENDKLTEIYTQMAADLKLSPKELSQKINYYVEKDKLLGKQQTELEVLVKNRTKELEETNAELKRFNDLSIGRELKMMELKEKIRELESRGSQGSAT
jgi:Na+/proline symporter